ncbi:MAG: VPLPA-CTERM sorting domain-containing protein [Pseudomonadota bacterium]
MLKYLLPLVLCAGTASAATTTIDFNGFVSGTDLTGVELSGVTFTRGSNTIITEVSPSGMSIRGGSFSDATPYRADFNFVTDMVSVDLGDFGNDSDFLQLRAYDAVGALLASTSGSLGTARGMRTLTVTATDIAYVEFEGGSGAFFPGSVYADNFTFNTPAPVPLPAAGGMLALAVAGFGVMRRRRQGAAKHL